MARAQALRSLLARCSTKCPAAAAAASSSCLRRAVPSYSQRILPAFRAASVPAVLTRSLATTARGGAGPDEPGAEEDEEEAEAQEWEEDEDYGTEPEVVWLRNPAHRAPTSKPNDIRLVFYFLVRFRLEMVAMVEESSCGTSSGASSLSHLPRRSLPSISAMMLPCSPSRCRPRDTFMCGWTSSPTG